MAITKYDVLRALVNSQAREMGGDQFGWHHLVAAVIEEISETHGSEAELAEAIYELIAGGMILGEEDEDGAGAREHSQ